MADELFSLKNNFWVGSFETGLRESQMLSESHSNYSSTECLFYTIRCQLGAVLNPVVPSTQLGPLKKRLADESELSLQILLLLIQYYEQPDLAVLTLNDWLQNPTAKSDPLVMLIAGLIYGLDGKYVQAFACLGAFDSLEHMMAIVHLYLKMNRSELAENIVNKMIAKEEDSTLTQLAMAWLYIYQGSKMSNEAALLFDELIARFGSCPQLCNGAALAYMNMQNFPQAERLLLESLQKNPSHPETLANLVVVSQLIGGKDSEKQKYMEQLEQIQPTHHLLQQQKDAELNFDTIASSYKQ